GEIRDIVLVVDRAAEWREIELNPPSAMTLEWKAVAQISTGIVDFTDFLRAFRNKIRPDGTLEDRASPELARIRRDIEKQKRALQDSLRAYLRRLAEGGTVLGELELQFAKARFAEDYNCVPIALADTASQGQQSPRGDGRSRPSEPGKTRLVLLNARHPLLERNLKSKGAQVVPTTVELEAE